VRSCNNCCAIGRKLAEATNALRMRRSRGVETLRLRFLLRAFVALLFVVAEGFLTADDLG